MLARARCLRNSISTCGNIYGRTYSFNVLLDAMPRPSPSFMARDGGERAGLFPLLFSLIFHKLHIDLLCFLYFEAVCLRSADCVLIKKQFSAVW